MQPLFYKEKVVFRLLQFLMLIVPIAVYGQAVDFERQTITVALTQEPPMLNSIRSTDLVSFFILGHTNEGLLRYDSRGRLVPGVAESWKVYPDRLEFRLRSDAHWSDGSRIIADDFVFAWQRINDPAEAAPFAAIMYPIKNAERIQKGELPIDSLGVSAIDDHTLVVLLENPCGHCLSLMPHGSFFPVKRAFYEAAGDLYGSQPAKLLANGPFELTSWTHGASLTLSKNASYWDEDSITLQQINIGYITEDNRTRLNLFVDQKIALVKLGGETIKDASSQGLRLSTFSTGGLAYLRFNVSESSVMQHKALRQAVQAIFDPAVFVNKVIAIPGYRPAYTFFPRWLRGVEGRFTDEYPVTPRKTDVNRGLALVSSVRSKITAPITLLTVASPTGSKVAEYLQGLLKQTLDLDVRVDQQTFKLYLDKSRKAQFDIAISSWYPDFDDIMTYADLQASWNANNRGKYMNDDYDGWLRVLQEATEPKIRMDAAARLQDILLEDVPVLPTAETGSTYIQHPKLKGVIRRVIGQDPDFTYSRVVQ
jgi:oligopeptide transport system substrate-binding protein